jgi:hypothetical protein
MANIISFFDLGILGFGDFGRKAPSQFYIQRGIALGKNL